MATINPHINFNGNAEEAFNFYRSVFGGEFTDVMRLRDLGGENPHTTENDKDKILFIGLPIGNGNILIGNDVPEALGRVNERENRSKIAISAESVEEADALFMGLSRGGEIEMPMGESPWGSYYGSFRDKYGIEWTIHVPRK